MEFKGSLREQKWGLRAHGTKGDILVSPLIPVVKICHFSLSDLIFAVRGDRYDDEDNILYNFHTF